MLGWVDRQKVEGLQIPRWTQKGDASAELEDLRGVSYSIASLAQH